MSVRYRRNDPLPIQTKKVEDEDEVEEKNHDALVAGLVIGNYKFTLVPREELTAIRIEEPA